MIKFSESKTENSKLSVKCNTCERDTYHTVVRAVDYKSTDDAEPDHVIENGLSLNGTAQIIVCNGCNTISFRDKHFFSEDPGPNVSIYPPREEQSASNELYLRDEMYAVPRIVKTIYHETFSAIKRKNPTLAGIGLRAIIELVCKDKGINVRGIEAKIDKLVEKGFLTCDGAEILHGIRIIGNEAAHDGKAPKRKQINAAMKIIDHLLLGIYIIPEEAADALPKRQKKTTKKTSKTTTTKQKSKAKRDKK